MKLALLLPKDCSSTKHRVFISQVKAAAAFKNVSLDVYNRGEEKESPLFDNVCPSLLNTPVLLANDSVFYECIAAVAVIMDTADVSELSGIIEEYNAICMSKGERIEAHLDFASLSDFGQVLFFGLILEDARIRLNSAQSEWFSKTNERSKLGLERRIAPDNNSKVKQKVIFINDLDTIKRPVHDKRNILITSALPYVNNTPHLGNIIGALLSADVFARYCRSRGHQTLYVCGTDEYGTATETMALKQGMSCRDLCDKYYKIHASIYEWFGISTDIFGRSSTEKQTMVTHEVFRGLYDRKYFFEQSVEQCFCEGCKRFLADRYVEGTCPHCSYTDARGDQCDGCGKLLNPTELIDAHCKVCSSTPIVKQTNHLFLDLAKLQPLCEKFVERQSRRGDWSSNSISITKSWLNEGLLPRCMTRDLKWGTSVPLPGFEDKVFYVWFDACLGYMSITANYCEEWREWWQSGRNESCPNVELFQFMGKDNVPFHTVIFPSTLIGSCAGSAGEGADAAKAIDDCPWTLLHHINTTEYLNYQNGKFSKSRNVGVFGNDAMNSGIPVSVWRYYLLSQRPEHTDSQFLWSDFGARCNNELLSNLGNFVMRVTKFTKVKFDGIVPRQGEFGEIDSRLISSVNEHLGSYINSMESVHLKAALKTVMSISSLGNQYLTESKLDNRLLHSDPEHCGTIISLSLNLIYLLSALLEPFLPHTSVDICKILEVPAQRIGDQWVNDAILQDHIIGDPFHLFSKIDSAVLEEMQFKFSEKHQDKKGQI